MGAVALERDKLAYNVPEAVKATGLSRATLFKEIKEGRLKSRLVCGRRLVMADDLSSFLDGAASRRDAA